MNSSEQIAASAALAAWAGAAASTLASLVALAVAVWSARRDARHSRRQAKDQETAFAFGMVGGLEMVRPPVAEAQARPGGATPRRRFVTTVEHAQRIADAALGIRTFDMQMLRDAYLIRGVLHALRSLADAAPSHGPDDHLQHAGVLEVVEPVLPGVLDADDRFLPAIGEVKGVDGRTPLGRRSG